MAQGASNQEIADRLCLSLNTVKTYLQRVNQKLGAESRIEAVSIATKRGIL